MLECVRQTIINSLLEVNCSQLFEKILTLDEEGALLPKISVSRITLQAIRQSKEFADYLLFQEKSTVKLLLVSLSSTDPVVFGTASQILSQLIKCCKEKKKEKVLEGYLLQYLPIIMVRFKDISKGLLNTFGALTVLQEFISLDNPVFFIKIVEEI